MTDYITASNDILAHVMWKNGLPDPKHYTCSLHNDSGEKIRNRINFLKKIIRSTEYLGLGESFEGGLLCLAQFHPYEESQLPKVFELLGYDPKLVKSFEPAYLSVLTPEIYEEMYPISIFGNIKEAANLNESHYLFDPYYGMLLWREKDRFRCQSLALGAFIKTVQALPPVYAKHLFEHPERSLSVGIEFAQLLFIDLLTVKEKQKLNQGQVPEIVVNSETEYEELITKIKSINQKASGIQIWFRGQTDDHLLPDRSKLAKAGVLPYSNVKDSSFVPSLYRNIDKYVYDDELYLRFIKHYGEWSLRSKILFGARYVVERNGKIIENDPSQQIPEGCTASVSFAAAGAPQHSSQQMDELGPYTIWTITDQEGNVVDTFTKRHFPALAAYQSNLLLQHYGCHTSGLDITSDQKVASWFATHKITGTEGDLLSAPYDWTSKTCSVEWPTIYVMCLVPAIHPFLNSAEILRGTAALRPIRQSCGLLAGSGNLCRNYGARYICLKIRLAPTVTFSDPYSASYLFPDENQDGILEQLLKFESKEKKEDCFFPVYKVRDM